MRSWIPGAVLALALTSSCRTASRYDFEGYSESVFAVASELPEGDLAGSIAQLEQTSARALADGLVVPPGMYAHLGLLYLMTGNRPAAVAAFGEERALYPESTVFIDGMIRRLEASP